MPSKRGFPLSFMATKSSIVSNSVMAWISSKAGLQGIVETLTRVMDSNSKVFNMLRGVIFLYPKGAEYQCFFGGDLYT